MLVQEPVQAAIWHCLNHYAYKDAIFLAERLNAEMQSEDTLFLLATCYYRANRRNQCYSILNSHYESSTLLNSRCKFLLAHVCLEMNKLSEAEQILLSEQKPKEEPIETVVNSFGDSSPFACQLLGQIANQTERLDLAKEAYLRSLKLNPFLFEAYTSLCDMGENIDPNTVFQTSHLTSFSKCHGSQNLVSFVGGENQEPVIMGVSNLNSTELQAKYFCTPVLNNRVQNPAIKPIPVTIPSVSDEVSVLHPANKNRPVKYRNLFTSTPMGGKAPEREIGSAESENATQNQAQQANINSTNNSSSVINHTPSSTFGFGFIPLESSTEPNTYHSFSCNSPFMMVTPTPGTGSDGGGDSSEPRAKKPCLRVPHSWQQPQTQAGSFLVPHNVHLHTPAGNTVASNPTTANATNNTITPTTPGPQSQPLNPQTANVRRSSRLFSNSNVSVKENNKTPPRSRYTPSKSPSRKNKLRNSTNKPNTQNTVSSNNKDPTLQENQKNSQIIAEDLQQNLPSVIENENMVEYKYVTPYGNDKSAPASIVNLIPSEKQTASPYPQNLHSQPDNLALSALNLQKRSSAGLMTLFRHLGAGYLSLCQYQCKDTLTCFSSLKENHMNTGWVLAQKAKALLELSEYEEAVKCYNTMRQLEPYRIDGLEWLSTALWHLQSEVDLSALAHDLLSQNKEHPATWIASGNCFSLHKEHETALKFFDRAIQVDPNCAYAYTLLGHEYVATEELDKAMRCFRHAARIDRRHYNAWYGIGMIYYKQERYSKAELYYKKALEVHQENSVLLCHLGVVQHALGRTEQSLSTFNKALSYNTQNPLCKFHRASVLFAANKLDEALKELKELKQIVPKESLVYFLIAKVYSKQGDTHKALLHFSWATDLDPKGANNQIKESIEPVLSRSLSALTMSEAREEDELRMNVAASP